MDRVMRRFLASALVIGYGLFGYAQQISIAIPVGRIVAQAGAMESQQSGTPGTHGSGKEMGFQFVGAEPAISTHVVKGEPYSLEATVDTEQTLADGNRIAHHQVVHVYRDSEGRTRREETLAAIGPWAASGTPPVIVTIQDPVAGTTYSLDPENKVATKLPTVLAGKIATTPGIHIAGTGIAITARSLSPSIPPENPNSTSITAFSTDESGAGAVIVDNEIASPIEAQDEVSDSLGKQSIAGVSAEGVRLTMTIPAETMGNKRPFEITKERWFSPELQIVLRSKQSDPRFGVTTYEVTKLDRENPAPSLFEVPRDYRIRKAPQPPPLPPAPPK